ncbi:MAG: SpoIID/LytB domain-containing protein [Elusimicrobiota bacterium]|jgi:stage II sporulation protein D|nr:SpoIID/LytB domain-containing protein [Elusimicrobiota bacterium]
MKIKKILYSFFIVIIFSLDLFGLEAVNPEVRVGLMQNVKTFSVSAKQRFWIVDSKGQKITYSKNSNIKFSFSNNVAVGAKKAMSLPLTIVSKGDISINGKYYHGSFEILRAKSGVTVVNIIDLEEYVKGVVPKEAMPNWKLEALKTQAVISRSWAIANLDKHKNDGFDICADPHCQVYGGADVETPNTDEAVKQTRGQVLIFDGKIANAYYFSNSGGFTEDPNYVWGHTKTPPYLKAKKDPYSKNEPNFNWEFSIGMDALRNKFNLGKISSIKPQGKTASGAPREIVIKHSKGTKTITPVQLRTTLGQTKIKSAFITSIQQSGTNFIFKGNGFGHRVGLSQWGAKAMAELGKNYKSILHFYYPGTKIEQLKYE